MDFIADIVKILPPPFNWLTIILLLLILLLIVLVLGYSIIKLLRSKAGFTIGNVSVGGNGKSVTLSEDNVEKLFRVFITTITTTIEKNRNKRVISKMEKVEGKLGTIFSIYKQAFYHLLKDKGVEARKISSHDDFYTFQFALNEALYIQSGENSFKSILKSELKDQVYQNKKGSDYDSFIDNVGERLHTVFQKTFDTKYKNSLFYGHNEEQIFRIVSVEDIYTLWKDSWKDIKQEIKEIFDRACEIDEQIDKAEQEEMEESISTIKTVLLGE